MFAAQGAGSYTIHIYDMTGKKINTQSRQASIGTHEAVMDVSTLAAGVYQLIIEGRVSAIEKDLQWNNPSLFFKQ